MGQHIVIISEKQIVFNYDVGNSFQEWASGAPSDENVVCQVNTAQAAIAMVASGAGIAFIPDSCVCEHEQVTFVPLENWHQALYMCILYDKWLEPAIWKFRETLTSTLRNQS